MYWYNPPIKKIVDKKLYAASEENLINYISFIEENLNTIGIVELLDLQELALTLVGSYAEGYEKVLIAIFLHHPMLILLMLKGGIKFLQE